MSRYALVDISLITTNIPYSAFQEAQIEKLADQILEAGGLLKPLIVKKMGLEKYVLFDGGLEYYAAMRAREKDPRKAEMVNTFVISPGQEEIITKQLETLKQPQGGVDPVKPDKSPANKFPEEQLAKALQRLNELSEKQLDEALKGSGIQAKAKTVKAIVEVRSQKDNQKFEDFSDLQKSVTKIKITPTTRDKIIDYLSR